MADGIKAAGTYCRHSIGTRELAGERWRESTSREPTRRIPMFSGRGGSGRSSDDSLRKQERAKGEDSITERISFIMNNNCKRDD